MGKKKKKKDKYMQSPASPTGALGFPMQQPFPGMYGGMGIMGFGMMPNPMMYGMRPPMGMPVPPFHGMHPAGIRPMMPPLGAPTGAAGSAASPEDSEKKKQKK